MYKRNDKSRKRTRTAELDVPANADDIDNSNSVDWTSFEPLNALGDAARLKTDASANFGEVDNSKKRKTADMSCSLETLKTINTPENRTRKKKKKKKSRVKTETAEKETSIDSVSSDYNTCTRFSNASANFGEVDNSRKRKTADMSCSLETLKTINTPENRTRKKKKKKKSRVKTETAENETSIDLVSSDCNTCTRFSNASANFGEVDNSRKRKTADMSCSLETLKTINTPENRTRKKKKKKKSREKTETAEYETSIDLVSSDYNTCTCFSNASANFGEVDNSRKRKTADMSCSLETLKTINTPENHARKKKKKKKRVKTETAEYETSIDLVSSDYNTGTCFSLNATTEDLASPRNKTRHQSKSEHDMESANVSISQKPKKCKSQKRKSTQSETQDSTNMGEVGKSRDLPEGDLSATPEAATEVNVFENHTRETMKKNHLSRKEIHKCEVSKSRDQSDCDPVDDTLDMATEVSVHANHLREKKRKLKSSKKARTGYCETSVEALSLHECTGEPQTGITEGQKGNKKNDKKTNELVTQSAFKTKTNHHDVRKQPSVPRTSRVRVESDSATASIKEDHINLGEDYDGCLSCYLCSEEQADGAGYIYHLAKQHCIKVYLCPYCSASMSSFEQFKRHLKFACRRNSVLIRPHRCQICPAKFTYIFMLIKHVKAVHEDNPYLYPCSHCSRTFTDLKNAKAHIAKCREGLASTEIKTKTKKCSQCEKMFSSVNSLYCHTKTIHGNAVFKCLCGLSFLGSRYFYAHCKVCGFKDSMEMDS